MNREIEVRSENEFINAIKDNNIILIRERIDLEVLLGSENENIKIERINDKKTITIHGIKGLKVISTERDVLHLGEVSFIIENCSDIRLEGMDIYGDLNRKEAYILIKKSNNITINSLIKGSYNNSKILSIIDSNNIYLDNHNIEGVVEIKNSKRIYNDISNFNNIHALDIGLSIKQKGVGKGIDTIETIIVEMDIYIQYKSRGYINIFNKGNIFSNAISPSKVSISPKKNKCVFISPFEWEVRGNLYLYNFNDHTNQKIVNSDEIGSNNKIKRAVWIDEDTLALIIGLAYGTVSTGGDVYKYNINEKTLVKMYECEKYKEVSDLKFEDGNLTFNIDNFDENMNFINNEHLIFDR